MSRPIFINLVLAGLLLMPAFGNKHLLRGKRTKEFQDDIKFIISDRELKHKDKNVLDLDLFTTKTTKDSTRSEKIFGTDSKKKTSKSSDGLGAIWALPFMPIVPMVFAGFTANQCRCRGGILGGGGGEDSNLCDCLCFCDSVNTDLTPVMFDPFTVDVFPDVVNPDEETCGCVVQAILDMEFEQSEPIAADDFYITDEGVSITLNVVENDANVGLGDLFISDFTQPNNGNIIKISEVSLQYIPKPGFVGTDSFEYSVSNGNGGFDTGRVSILVNAGVAAGPEDFNNVLSTMTGNTLVISPSSILGSDNVSASGTMSMKFTTEPMNGEIQMHSDGTFSYIPNDGFVGVDTVEYTITFDNGETIKNSLAILVNDVNDKPEANNVSFTTSQSVPISIDSDDILINDEDSDGDPLTIVSISQPFNGQVSLNTNGLIYIPTNNFVGTDSFTYTVSDGKGGTDTATISIVVKAVIEAADDSYTTEKNTPFTISAPGILSNDVGNNLSVISMTVASNGAVNFAAGGGFTYAPDRDFVGVDSFEYTIKDSFGGVATARVVIVVEGDSSPISSIQAVNDSYTARKNIPFALNDPGILANDIGSRLVVTSIVRDPSNGSMSFASNGGFTYTPGANFVGVDTFDYSIQDRFGNDAVATVIITVQKDCGRYSTDTEGNLVFIVGCDEVEEVVGDGSVGDGIILHMP